jgi:hypothetical protein
MNPFSKEKYLARTSEPSESANTVPPPELNPLQNPLLAENMNRWAEVYFTNPPERRDAAVVELLQELVEEKQRGERQRKPVMVPFTRSRELSTAPRGPREEVVYCGSCRTENPASHQFCGNCGQKLDAENQQARESQMFRTEESNTNPAAVEARPRASTGELQEEATGDETQEYVEGASAQEQEDDSAPYTPPFSNSDLSLFQSLRVPDDVDEEDWEYGPQKSGSYRYYVAAVLAILIVGLGYLAWRGAQSSQAGNVTSAPPAVAAGTEQPPTPAPTEKSEPTQPAPSQPAAKSTVQPTKPADTAAAKSTNETQSDGVVKASETQPLAAKAGTPRGATSGNGAEELAMAQSYLNGTSGRDSSEAAKWLWKSISKHNGQATLVLADLYLRGDGVPKNCEQGRILLDSAAQRGIRGAGERLRNLQAFGCH